MNTPTTRTTRQAALRFGLIAVISLLAIELQAQTTFTWGTTTSPSSWAEQGNWTSGTLPTTALDTADFSTLDLGADTIVTLDANQNINRLIFSDTDTSTAGSWIVNTGSVAGATLTLGGTMPTITVNELGAGKITQFNLPVAGTAGLFKNGAGQLQLNLPGTYTGGTVLSQGTISIATIGTGQLGTGAVTITNGASLLMYRSDTTDNASVGSFTNSIQIPSGESATLWCSARSVSGAAGSASTFTPMITGGGTLTMRINNPSSRAGNAANFSTFTGTLNVTRRNAADTYAVAHAGTTAPGFPSAKVNLAAGVTMNQWLNPPSSGSLTTTHTIGELSGEVGSVLGGNPVSGRFVNWSVGALGTTATFAGSIRNDAGAAMITKVGAGTWILSGTNTYTGATLVSAGKLVGVTGGSISNTASFTVASGATNGVVVASPNGQWTTTNVSYNAGTTCLELNLGGSPSTTVAPFRVLGALTANSTVNVSVFAGNVTAGATYPLVQYGTLGGSGFSAFNLAVTGPHFTGHLVNNSGAQRIDLVVDSVTQPLRWATGSGDWDIATTANWVDTTSASTTYQEASGLGDAVLFEDGASGTAPIAVNLGVSVAPASVTISNDVKGFTLSGSGAISGTGSLSKLGTNSLTLGLTNAYSGGSVLGGGTVSLATANAGVLGTGTVTLTNGALLSLYRGDADDNAVVASFANPVVIPAGQSGTIWASPRMRTGTSGSAPTFTPTVTGAGTLGLRVNYVGYIGGNWSGFAGQLNVTPRTAAEEFQIANGGAVATGFPNAAIHLASGVTMVQVVNPPNSGDVTTTQPIGELSGDAGSVLGGNPVSGRYVNWAVGSKNTDATFAGNITDNSGAARITKVGTGTWTWTGTASHTGSTAISNGTLVVNGSITASPVTVYSGATLGGTGAFGASVTLNAGSTITPGVTAYGTMSLADLAFAGGTNRVDISSSSSDLITVSGGLNLSGGVVRLNVSGSLPNGTYTLIQYGSISGGSVATLTLSGFSQPGQIASLEDSGAGQINLVVAAASSANLTWVGDSILNWWDINLSANWTNGASMTVYQEGDKVTFNDIGSESPALDIRASVQPGSVTVNATKSYTFQSSTGGKISGTAGLTKAGLGTLTVLTLNDNTGGALISGGVVQVGNGGTAGDLGPGNITNNASLVFQQPDNRTVMGVISGSGSLEQNSAATLALQADNTYSGGTTIASGATLQVGTGGSTGSLGTGVVTNNGTLTLNRSNALTVANNIMGSGALIKNGAGALTLSGVNSYENNTYINNGVLKLGASERIPNGGSTTGWLILDGGATAGTIDLNGFNETVNALSGLAGATLGSVTNSAASGTNSLTTSDGNTTTFAGLIADNPTGAKVALIKGGTGQLTLSGVNTYGGGTVISNGTLVISQIGALGSGVVTLAGGTYSIGALKPTNVIDSVAPSTISGGSGGGLAGIGKLTGNSTVNINITTGVFDWIGDMTAFSGSVVLGSSGGVRLNGTTGSSLATFDLGTGTASINLRNPPRNISFGALMGGSSTWLSGDSAAAATVTYTIGGNNTNATYSGTLANGSFAAGSLTAIVKEGTGTQAFDGVLTYGGSTTISNGVLAIAGAAELTNTAQVNIRQPGTLDLSGAAIPGLELGKTISQALTGAGTNRGFVSVAANSAIRPGNADIGTLTITGPLTNNGTITMELSTSNAPTTNDLISAASVVAAGGSLIVTNVGPDLTTSNYFKLFSAPVSGSFATISLPVSNAVNTVKYTWQTNLAVDGSILLLSAAPNAAVATNPTNLVFSAAGGNLTLSWPSSHTGWRLQVQTNSRAVGLNTNWFDVSGATATNQMTFPVSPADPTVFFRMVYP